MAKGDIPAKNSSEWIKNEKIINQTPFLRNARDHAEGLTSREPGTGHSVPFTGKGSNSRPLSISKAEFDHNWDRIFGKKDKTDE